MGEQAVGKSDTWYAYFVVTGSFEPDEIARRVGVSPTYAVKEGEPGRYAKRVKCSRWELRSRLDMKAPLEAQVKTFLTNSMEIRPDSSNSAVNLAAPCSWSVISQNTNPASILKGKLWRE
jgi:hypothetical protein